MVLDSIHFQNFLVQIDNKKKDILILGICPTQLLDYTTLSAEAQYSISFSRSNRKFL